MASIAATKTALLAVVAPVAQFQASVSSNASPTLRIAPLKLSRSVFGGNNVATKTITFSQKRASLAVSSKLSEECESQISRDLADENTQSSVGTVMAGALFAFLANAGSAAAAEEVLQLADADARGFSLLLILVPAIGWVLFNILQPALNQVNKMRGVKSLIGAVGLAAASSLLVAPQADAAQQVAELAVDARPLILLVILGPAIGWVLFNILQPALNQLNKMSNSKKSVIGALGLGAASLVATPSSEAAQEVAQLAVDYRPLLPLVIIGAAAGWVLFNILGPALNQINNMQKKK